MGISQDTQNKKVVLLYGRFPEFFDDGIRPLDIPECTPSNEKNWMGWTKKNLEQNDFDVYCPIVPEVWKAPYSAWKKELDAIHIDFNTTLVGLSQGAGAMLRYISEEKKTIKKLILIAPVRDFFDKEWGNFYRYEIDNNLKDRIEKGTTVFYDPNDYEIVQETMQNLQQELHAQAMLLSGLGHFSFEIPTLPELLKEIQEAYV